jgi:hypothetical protein
MVFSADQLTEIGEVESTAAPMTVAPIRASFRIVALPAYEISDKKKATIVREMSTLYKGIVRSTRNDYRTTWPDYWPKEKRPLSL